jgi:putative tryptophan/tyrosine transport system substrate-binding protein
LGYVEEQNLHVEYRWGEGTGRTYPELAAELVKLNVEVIVTVASPSTRATKEATDVIPIVMVDVGDPVAFGFVTSLARPGRNLTGLSAATWAMGPKGLEILKDLVPKRDASRCPAESDKPWCSAREQGIGISGTYVADDA